MSDIFCVGDNVVSFKALWGLFFISLGSTAYAATETLSLDFDSVVYEGGPVLSLNGATIENLDGEDLFIYRTDDFGFPSPGGFCALDAAGVCKADIKITFEDPVSDLMFSSFFVSGNDGFLLRAVVGDTTRSFFVTSEELIDLSDLDGVTEVRLFDVSGPSDKGIAFGSFSFTEFTPIPLPAGFPLLLSALVLLGFGRLRSNARSSA